MFENIFGSLSQAAGGGSLATAAAIGAPSNGSVLFGDVLRGVTGSFQQNRPNQFAGNNRNNNLNSQLIGNNLSLNAPGSALINGGSFQGNGRNQNISALGVTGGGNPLQGYAGASAVGTVGGAIGALTGGGLNAAQGFAFPNPGASRGGLVPLVLGPVIGLFTFVKSLFQLKKFDNETKPVDTSHVHTGYDQYNEYIQRIESDDGWMGGNAIESFEQQDTIGALNQQTSSTTVNPRGWF